MANTVSNRSLDDALRVRFMAVVRDALTNAGEELLVTGSNEYAGPCVDASGNDNRLTAQVNDIINGSKGFVNYWQFYVAADMQLEFGQALAAMGAGKITPAEFVAQISSLF